MSKNFDRKEKIFYWLRSHPNLHYLVHVIRRFGNKRFYQLLFDEGYPGLITVDGYGEQNKGIEIFLINIGGDKIGLPCYIRYALLALYEIRDLNFIPVVEFSDKSGWLQEKHEINETNNIFEYYYIQPCNISLKQVYESQHVYSCNSTSLLIRANKDLGCYEENGLLASYDITEEYLEIMGQIFRKHLHLNEITKKFIYNSKNLLFDKIEKEKVLGVHIRGTDFAVNYANHPKMVMMEQFESVIDNVFKRGDFSKIFLATDDISKLAHFKKRYPEKILYYDDTYRAAGNKNIMSIRNDQEDSKYKKGLDVLRDVYTLASCNGLVSGLSHVSILARIVKKSQNESYKFQEILSNGIN